jgi:hypothetical protein
MAVTSDNGRFGRPRSGETAVAVSPHTAPWGRRPGGARGGPPPPLRSGQPQVGSSDCAGTLIASQAALTVLNSVQPSGKRLLAAVSVQVR